MNRETIFGIELALIFAISLVIVIALGRTTTAQNPPSTSKSATPTDFQETVALDKITVGTIVPVSPSLAEMGQATKAVIDAAFAEANLRGGINRHQLELKVIEIGDKPEITRANIERLLASEKVFAFAGAFIAGAETEVTTLIGQKEVPLIGPSTLDPQIGVPLNRYVFYLVSGLPDQAKAMVSFVANKSDASRPTLAVISSRSLLNARVVAAINEQTQKEHLNTQKYEYESGKFDAPQTVSQMRQTTAGSVFFLGRSEDLNSFLAECDKAGWFPQVLLQATGAGADLFSAPIGFQGKLFITFPTAPTDLTSAATEEFRALAEKYKLPAKYVAAQISAYAAAKILMEAIKQAGANLTRERLIQVLESFNGYQTGLTPNITYGPNRRIGAMGAYIVTMDLKEKKFTPVTWISVN